jgi:hypothetical protein
MTSEQAPAARKTAAGASRGTADPAAAEAA